MATKKRPRAEVRRRAPRGIGFLFWLCLHRRSSWRSASPRADRIAGRILHDWRSPGRRTADALARRRPSAAPPAAPAARRPRPPATPRRKDTIRRLPDAAARRRSLPPRRPSPRSASTPRAEPRRRRHRRGPVVRKARLFFVTRGPERKTADEERHPSHPCQRFSAARHPGALLKGPTAQEMNLGMLLSMIPTEARAARGDGARAKRRRWISTKAFASIRRASRR